MRFEPALQQATLIRRYKRFLADVRHADGTELTIHCPNSGSMRSCSAPGSAVCYSTSANPRRKYPHTLEMVNDGRTWIGVNTSRTNTLVVEAVERGIISELHPYDSLAREVGTAPSCRLDLVLERGGRKTFVEIKNCSLGEDGCALFPDAVTARGTKHLHELQRLVREGHAGVILFLVQRADCDRFAPAAAIDPLYARTLAAVHRGGVGVLVYQARVSPVSIEVVRRLPVILSPE